MTPKEKAIELYNKMYETGFKPKNALIRTEQAKECALIAVDEIIASNPKIIIKWAFSGIKEFDSISYWQEVKQEIEKL